LFGIKAEGVSTNLTEESGFNLLARSRACDAGAFGIGRESRRAGMRSSGINCRNAHYSLRPTLDEYDNEGNLIQKTSFSGDHTVYAWDHRNRLTSVTDYDDEETNLRGVNYSYDAFNQMVKRVEDQDGDTGSAAIDQAFYLYDQGQVALEFHKWGTGSATASHLSHRYLWNPAAVDQLLTDEQVVDLYNTEVNETLWALTDRLGSVTDMIDNFGGQRLHRSFDSFGNITYETHCDVEGLEVTVGWAGYLDEAFAYTGRFFDQTTGLQNNLNRWYDASTGRWLSEDPIGFAAGDANLYRYVGNSPTNYVDPLGLEGEYRPDKPPKKDVPSGTLPIDQYPGTKDKCHEIKKRLKDEGVGPKTWVGIAPNDDIIVPKHNGDAENLGPYWDYVHCDGTPKYPNDSPILPQPNPSPWPIESPPWWVYPIIVIPALSPIPGDEAAVIIIFL
jgi:RHS repeat-associated protein